jgi:hypothetical protein
MLAGLGAQAALAVADRQGAALQARFEARRDIQAEVAAFRERAPRIADVDALLKDRRALTMVLEAFQIESEIDKRGILRKILTEDPTEQASLANRLTDRRWRQLAAAFAPRQGQAPLGDPALLDRIVKNALTNRYEKAMGEANPGLREALYFRRVAAQATTVPQVMADSALLAVTRGALGLPEQFGLLSFEQQRDLVTRRLDLSALQDPKEVKRMAQRYLAQAQPATPSSPVLSLFGGSSGTGGIASLATLRFSRSA